MAQALALDSGWASHSAGSSPLSVAATTVNQISATGFTYDASGNMLTDG